MITLVDYNTPTGIAGNYFDGKAIPLFNVYFNNYHVHYLRYLYYMCILNAEGEYPSEVDIEKIIHAFSMPKNSKCKPHIKKILIGEAPPINPVNYFYNPSPASWSAAGRPAVGSTAWAGAIQTALFPGVLFASKVDFLTACAKKGFLLIDLFPYPIVYTSTNSLKYKTALVNAFGSSATAYPYNLFAQLNNIKCCLSNEIAIGFGLKRIGNPILSNMLCVADFTAWLLANGITLIPFGGIDLPRAIPAPVPLTSTFLRVCGRNGLFGPCPILLNIAMI